MSKRCKDCETCKWQELSTYPYSMTCLGCENRRKYQPKWYIKLMFWRAK